MDGVVQGARSRGSLVSLGRFLREKVVDPLRRAQGTPKSIARGVGIGLFIALTPTVGVQSLLVTACAVPLRANLPVSLVMCWITNPITLIPFYVSYYWVGAWLLNVPMGGYSAIADRIREQFALLPELGFIDSMKPLGMEILWPMCVGSLVLSTVIAWPSYHMTLHTLRRRKARREAARAKTIGTDGEAGAANAVEEQAIPDRAEGHVDSRTAPRAPSERARGKLQS
jgi:uncharacterized protein (DUF2062 family)